jgi:hypothetical protein
MRSFLLAAVLGVLAFVGPARAQIYAPPAGAYSPDQLVTSWYERFLGRQPDLYAEGWVSSLVSGQNPAGVLASILASDEFYTRAGGTPQGYITALFQNLTGQLPGPAQLRFWTTRLFTSNRTDVAYELLQRFPSGWETGGAPAYYPGTVVTPPVQVPVQTAPYLPYDYRYQYRHHHWDHDRRHRHEHDRDRR